MQYKNIHKIEKVQVCWAVYHTI